MLCCTNKRQSVEKILLFTPQTAARKEMEWLTTSNEENVRVSFVPPSLLESNFSNSICNFNYDPYAGNSYTQTGPESEKLMINAFQCPSNNNYEMIKKNTRLTSEQLASLEQSFQDDFRLDIDRKLKLSKELGMQPRQVAVWFQNRRARWKVKHLEESYDSLSQEYDVVRRENQMLQDEVKNLRAMIQRDKGVMKTQSNLSSSQIVGGGNQVGQYNTPELVAPSFWTPITRPLYPF